MIQPSLVPLQIGNTLRRFQIVDLGQAIETGRADFVVADEFDTLSSIRT